MTIHDAAWRGNIAAINRLLNTGVNINSRTREGMTPLMMAAVRGHTNVIRHLLKKGANARARAGMGNNRTALIFATESGNVNAVRALLSHSNLRAMGSNRRTALTVAASTGYPEMIRLLVRAGARPNRATRARTANNTQTRTLIGSMLVRRAFLRGAVHRLAHRRRTHAMRGQLGSARVQTGSTHVTGIPVHIRNMIARLMN